MVSRECSRQDGGPPQEAGRPAGRPRPRSRSRSRSKSRSRAPSGEDHIRAKVIEHYRMQEQEEQQRQHQQQRRQQKQQLLHQELASSVSYQQKLDTTTSYSLELPPNYARTAAAQRRPQSNKHKSHGASTTPQQDAGPAFFTYSMYEADSQSYRSGRQGSPHVPPVNTAIDSVDAPSIEPASTRSGGTAHLLNPYEDGANPIDRAGHFHAPFPLDRRNAGVSHRGDDRRRTAQPRDGIEISRSGTSEDFGSGRGSAARSASRSRSRSRPLYAQHQEQQPQLQRPQMHHERGNILVSREDDFLEQDMPVQRPTQPTQRSHLRPPQGTFLRADSSPSQPQSRPKPQHQHRPQHRSQPQSRPKPQHQHRPQHRSQPRPQMRPQTRRQQQPELRDDNNSVYTENTFGTFSNSNYSTSAYSTTGRVSVTPSMVSGAKQNYQRYQDRMVKAHSRTTSRGLPTSNAQSAPTGRNTGGGNGNRNSRTQEHLIEMYNQKISCASSGSNSSFTNSEASSVRAKKKLVVQYELVKSEGRQEGWQQDKREEEEVKVKARVEDASMSLADCLHRQQEENLSRSLMDRVGRKIHDQETQEDKKVVTHCIRPSSNSIDASDAIGIISSYITAYRALHRTGGRSLHKHDTVLVTKAHGALGRSIIELAISAGASQVVGVCPAKYTSRVSRWGATAMDETEYLTWSEGLMGAIDVVIDIDGGTNGDVSSAAAITANCMNGKLVRIFTNGPASAASAESKNGKGAKNNLRREPPNTSYYDVFTDMEEDLTGFRSDVQLLFDMVDKGYVRPKKKKEIPLTGMEYVEIRFERPSDESFRLSRSDSGRRGSVGRGRSRSSRGRGHVEQRDDIEIEEYENDGSRNFRGRSEDRSPTGEAEKGRGRSRSRSRGRSLSRPKFFRRGRSKSRTRGEGASEDWEDQSAVSGKSGKSGRSRSSTRSSGAGSLIKRSFSLTNLRRSKSSDANENDRINGNEDPWDEDYNYVKKKEHGNEFSGHYLMRDMSTQSFLLALGKEPNKANAKTYEHVI